MPSCKWNAFICVAICLLSVSSRIPSCTAKTKVFHWNVALINCTRNCFTKPLLVVNGQYPGPTIHVTEGDRVVVKVVNTGNVNVTIHWHGIRQMRSCWQDGVAYITECPIQPGSYEVYDFLVDDHRGTFFWHAHISWIRASVYGAFLIKPTKKYPYAKPPKEILVMLGEWWNKDVGKIEHDGLAEGGAFPLADALTMNGFPGSQYNCSESEGLTVFDVKPKRTYLLRLINAALNTEMFFAIANHSLTVVEADSFYVKPFTVHKGVVISPGQTLNVLVKTDQPPGTYYMVGKGHSTLQVADRTGIPDQALSIVRADIPPIPTTGLFQYRHAPVLSSESTFYPTLPDFNDTDYSAAFATSLKALHGENVPSSDDMRHLFFTVGSGTQPCTEANPCGPQQGAYRVSGMINNMSFVRPTTAILKAHYYGIPGVYSPTFPDFPAKTYDFTASPSPPLQAQVTEKGTRVTVLDYGTVVQLVLQDVNNLAFEAHPFHLHGYAFYVMGQGFGNYNASSDPGMFNYYDPPMRFTVSLPSRGWVAIRFTADNPGVWLLHCHLEKHLSFGMETVFIVKDGTRSEQKLRSPKRVNPC